MSCNSPFNPIALVLAVSDTTFALTCAFDNGPTANNELVNKKVAPYLADASVVPRNMAYPTTTNGVVSTMTICRLSSFQLISGSTTVKKAPTT